MASKLKLDISCPVCSEIYKDPVILSCSHSFCKACLQQFWESKQPSQCPVCKKTSSKDSFLTNQTLKTICESLSGIVLQEKDETQIESHEFEQPVCLDSKQPAGVFDSKENMEIPCELQDESEFDQLPDNIPISAIIADIVEKRKFKVHYEFVIDVKTKGGSSYLISRRYRQFFNLHKSMVLKLGQQTSSTICTLPTLPEKVLIGHKQDIAMKRVPLLNAYMKGLLCFPLWSLLDDLIQMFFCQTETDSQQCWRNDRFSSLKAKILADQQDAVHVLLSDSGEPSLQQALARAREEFDSLENVVLNVAVTGETGSGKSSLVNAIRDLKDADEEAAAVGVTETTMVPTMYSHPVMPNLRIWDLPGIGSAKFNASAYMKQVKFQTYDVFIIVSATRFKENELKLAKEIKKKNKHFYFVRTKIDQDVANAKRIGFAEDQSIKKIQEDCAENLCGLGCPIFLVSSHNRDEFQFQELLEALEKDLPIHKKYTLVMGLPVYSSQSLKKKYGAFKKAVWALTIASGAIGGIPVPGLSTAVDVAMIVSFLTKCYISFGLDDKSLNKLGQRVNKDILKMVKESELVMALADKSLVTKIAIRLGAAGGIETLCSFVPVAGNIAAAGISFVTTRAVLQEMLDELYSIAKKVIEMAGLK